MSRKQASLVGILTIVYIVHSSCVLIRELLALAHSCGIWNVKSSLLHARSSSNVWYEMTTQR